LYQRVKSNPALRFRIKKWFWTANPPGVVAIFFMPEVWDKVSILYLALVSVWALVDTAASGEQAAKAAKQQK
jgi:hypothetical protein